MLPHAEHTNRMALHTARLHCRCFSTCCRTSGGSSAHRLTPAARAASVASASASSRAASIRCATARARSHVTRRSSIELGFARPSGSRAHCDWVPAAPPAVQVSGWGVSVSGGPRERAAKEP
jgi:hypothetical protein